MGLFRRNCHTNRCDQSEVYHYSSRPPAAPTVTQVASKKINVTQRGRLKGDGTVEWTDEYDDFGKKVERDWASPNPNPGMFTIKRVDTFRNEYDVYLVAEINYVGCTNYEGNKVCVFKGISKDELMALTYLDPHFAESKFSPIARFKPDGEGWANARMFAKMLL